MRAKDSTSHWLLAALLVAVTAIWGWSFPVVKEAVAGYGVLSFLAIRFVIATAALGVFTAQRMDRKTLVTGAAIGLALAAGYVLQTFGIRHTTASNSGLITGLFVLFAPMANRALFGIRTPWILWGAVGLSVVGLVLLTGSGPERLRIGDILTLASAAAYGTHIALLGRFAKEHDAGALTLAQLVAATLVFAAAALATEPLVWPDGPLWTTIIVTGVLVTAVTYPIQTFVQKRLPPVRTAIILSMESVFAAIFGYLLLRERLTASQIAGAAVLVAAALAAEIGSAAANRPINHAFPPKE